VKIHRQSASHSRETTAFRCEAEDLSVAEMDRSLAGFSCHQVQEEAESGDQMGPLGDAMVEEEWLCP
jgi:hypothetical protein